MTNKIPQEIEEKLIKLGYPKKNVKWNIVDDAIKLSFKAGQKQSEDAFKEMIEDFFIKEDVILKKVDNKIAYLMISRNISHKEERDELIKLRQELLSKIGDNSEVEK